MNFQVHRASVTNINTFNLKLIILFFLNSHHIVITKHVWVLYVTNTVILTAHIAAIALSWRSLTSLIRSHHVSLHWCDGLFITYARCFSLLLSMRPPPASVLLCLYAPCRAFISKLITTERLFAVATVCYLSHRYVFHFAVPESHCTEPYQEKKRELCSRNDSCSCFHEQWNRKTGFFKTMKVKDKQCMIYLLSFVVKTYGDGKPFDCRNKCFKLKKMEKFESRWRSCFHLWVMYFKAGL